MGLHFNTEPPPLRSGAARAGMGAALRLLEEIGRPVFYSERAGDVEDSRIKLENSVEVRECFSYLRDVYENLGHGAGHSVRVAVDAGAIVSIECTRAGCDDALKDRCVRLVHIAALLHDIRRTERNHAAAGAAAAEAILRDMGFDDTDRGAVTLAISNHEAFRDPVRAATPDAQLISDALYDADKFRWGPDNFTETIWYMLEALGVPINLMVASYAEKSKGIEAVKQTFRTRTGCAYGPDFISRGLLIGEKLIKILETSGD